MPTVQLNSDGTVRCCPPTNFVTSSGAAPVGRLETQSAEANTVTRFTSTPTLFTKATVFATTDGQTPNDAPIFIGTSSVAGENPKELAPGESTGIEAPSGAKLDLSDFYFENTTSGDGIVVEYA